MLAPLTDRARARLEGSLVRSGIAVPWWVPVSVVVVGGTFALAALIQRIGLEPPPLLILAAVAAVVSALMWLITGEIAPSWLKSVGVLVAATLLLIKPVVPDFAPMQLAALTAELGAIARPALAATVTGASVVVLVSAGIWFGLIGTEVYVPAVVMCYGAGLMLRWYIRALSAERSNQKAVREQAILSERQRIAREVHDVVAHSLSITLLHLTGARHALQQDRDVDEAVEALTEAERVGRAAMADVRRTVGLLSGASPGTRALPGAEDIAELVEQTRAAGLDVCFEAEGDLTGIGASAGLGLYRIAQESLANIVKHAPDTVADLRLTVEAGQARLTVRNRLSPAAPRQPLSGSGLPGMAARAAQLGAALKAGPADGHWEVDVTVPISTTVPNATTDEGAA
ncbi:MAG TPA: histidine kinase [Pseudonocardiaceae bacterium]|nr:histidine kinase [Pseudonocardiaceae bacterium]